MMRGTIKSILSIKAKKMPSKREYKKAIAEEIIKKFNRKIGHFRQAITFSERC